MKKINLIAFVFWISTIVTFAQAPGRCSYITPKQADNWYFHFNAGMRFTDTGPVVNNLPDNHLPGGNGSAVISDINGNLLLYTDGMKVWNKDHVQINYGPNLNGDLGSIQPALIVPNPSVEQMYYIFTTDITDNDAEDKGFNYSRVDLTAHSGVGSVMEANINLLSKSTMMITGVKHYNTTDYWVMTHNLNNNEFKAYLVDASGVNTNPVTSNVGTSLSSDKNSREYLGTMKFSPQGDKVAYASYGKKIVEVFSFDNKTGVVSNPITLTPPLPTPNYGPYYVEFSPDGSKLYITVINVSVVHATQYSLYQYDLATNAISPLINDAPMKDDVTGLQLGRDGKIYVAHHRSNKIGVIENPNRPGTDCNYKEDAINLAECNGYTGLPGFITSFLNIPPVNYDTKCDGDATVFTLLNTTNVTSVDWDFGDPVSVDNIVTGTFSPTHIFSNDTIFNVKYTEHFGTGSWSYTFPVVINALPAKSFASDSAYIYPGTSLQLYGGDNMYSYFWQDGSINSSYTATKEGIYTVLIEDMKCCQNMDTLTVTGINLKIPTAFTPNGDNVNDLFRVIGTIDGIVDYSFSVFNKWGQLMWETDDIIDSWNGKMGSDPAPAGMYSWHMSFNVRGNIMNSGKAKMSGVITILK